MSTPTTAVYGLGNMGFEVARRIAAQFAVKVFDLDERRMARAEDEFCAIPMDNVTQATDCRTVVLSLPNPAASLSVVTELAKILEPGATILETSTVNPDSIRDCEAILTPRGIHIIDVSLLAGVSQMVEGTATLLLGGDRDVIAGIQGVLDAISLKQRHFGPAGTGAAAKVINNAVAHAVMVVVAEAGSMAVASGVSSEGLVDLLSDESMGLHRPLTYRYAQRVAAGDFRGGMPLSAARKDSTLALELAQGLGVPLFAIQATQSAYDIASARGYDRDDYAAVTELWREWGHPAYGSKVPESTGDNESLSAVLTR